MIPSVHPERDVRNLLEERRHQLRPPVVLAHEEAVVGVDDSTGTP